MAKTQSVYDVHPGLWCRRGSKSKVASALLAVAGGLMQGAGFLAWVQVDVEEESESESLRNQQQRHYQSR